MTHYIIFPANTAGALLQHSGEFRDAGAAFAEFVSLAGDASITDFAVVEVTAEQRREVEDWSAGGSPAWDAPEWLDNAILKA